MYCPLDGDSCNGLFCLLLCKAVLASFLLILKGQLSDSIIFILFFVAPSDPSRTSVWSSLEKGYCTLDNYEHLKHLSVTLCFNICLFIMF